MDQLTNGKALASALRSKASDVREVYSESEVDNQSLRDAACLLRVLANVVEGMPIQKAFGAPGDWGYETALGKGVLALHRPDGVAPSQESSLAREWRSGDDDMAAPAGVMASDAPLSDERILHLWDTHVAYETGQSVKQPPLDPKDKLAFARAVLNAAGVPPCVTGHSDWHNLNSAADAVLHMGKEGDWDEGYSTKLAAWLRRLATDGVEGRKP